MVTALQHGTWMDEEGFKKTCIREKKKRGDIHQPFYGTWVADFMLRQDAGRFMLGKYLSDKKIPWRRRRRLGIPVPRKPWVGEGGKATLVGAPDADILLEAIEELRKRTTAGAAMLMVKVKAHRGEPANEEADIQADKAISPTEWHDRTNRAVSTWQEPRWKGGTVSYED